MSPRPLQRSLLIAVLALLPAVAQAWPHAPTTLNAMNNNITFGYTPLLLADGTGGVFATWTDYRAGGYDVIAQHFDSEGRELWTHNGLVVCGATGSQSPVGIVSDGAGGILVGWSDYRTNPNGDLYAARVTSAGALPWTANGVVVCAGGNYPGDVQLAADASGGAFFAWHEQRSGSFDIFVQRLGASGAAAFAANGFAVCAAAGNQFYPRLAADGYGNGFVVWEDWRGSSADIYMQQVNTSGGVQYAANGVAVCALPSSSTSPRITLTTNFDPIVVWVDGRNGLNEIFAQYLRAWDGGVFWVTNGLSIMQSNYFVMPINVVRDAAGGFVVAGQQSGDGSGLTARLVAQRFDLLGATSWPAPGALVRSGNAPMQNVSMASDGAGGTLFAWQDLRAVGGDVYAQRLGPDGYVRYPATGLPVCTAGGTQQYTSVAAGANGAAYVAFDDYSVGRPCLMAVDEWGYMGAAPILNDVRDVPNDQGGQVKVSWYASPLDTDPLYRNITQYIVYRSVPPQAAARVAPALSASEDGTATVGGRRYLQTRHGAQVYFWEELEQVTARHLSTYSVVTNTTGDSLAGSNPLTAFLVMAVGNYGASFWTSQADSGYSVDNLAPAAPAPFSGQYAGGTVALHWDPNTEGDLAGYRLYRGTSPGFTPGPGHLVATLPDTGYAAPAGAPYVYKLTAIDAHGNESPAATLIPAGTLSVDAAPLTFFFAPPAPNPAAHGGASVLRYALPAAGRVDLRIHDAAGRLVRTLASGDTPAGEYRVAWDGTDADGRAVPAGLYFAKLAAGARVASVRIVRID